MGINQATLAKKMHVKDMHVSLWLNNHRAPDLPNVIKIADALNCSLDDIVIRVRSAA
jgi:transcriptional regulator with XRE-family HTH domain